MKKLNTAITESFVNESFKQTNKDLLTTLDKAVDLAKKAYKEANQEKDSKNGPTGSESQDVVSKLEAIYAAMTTGDPKDDSNNDQIFK